MPAMQTIPLLGMLIGPVPLPQKRRSCKERGSQWFLCSMNQWNKKRSSEAEGRPGHSYLWHVVTTQMTQKRAEEQMGCLKPFLWSVCWLVSQKIKRRSCKERGSQQFFHSANWWNKKRAAKQRGGLVIPTFGMSFQINWHEKSSKGEPTPMVHSFGSLVKLNTGKTKKYGQRTGNAGNTNHSFGWHINWFPKKEKGEAAKRGEANGPLVWQISGTKKEQQSRGKAW